MALVEQRLNGRAAETDSLLADRVLRPRFVFSLGRKDAASQQSGEKEIAHLPDSLTFAAPSGAYLVAKRISDVCLATFGLLLFLPFFVLIAIAIFAEDRGPILFRQTRVGKNGRPFPFLKFRSMVPNAEALKQQLAASNEATGPIFKMRSDPRVTHVGRWLRRYSLDELPQLINVIRGELSLVGPRPHLPHEVAYYTDRQRQRLSVQPGLVCLREVCGRSNLSFERWIEMDLLYIQYRSLRTDLRILRWAIFAVVKSDGAY
jgi:lipopolysaccharide/colanic/teichoic acid biosynthesis glycosyltransferase